MIKHRRSMRKERKCGRSGDRVFTPAQKRL